MEPTGGNTNEITGQNTSPILSASESNNAQQDNSLTDGERASISSAIAAAEGIRGELQSALSNASGADRDFLQGQLTTISGSIADLKTAIKSNNKSSLTASIAAVTCAVGATKEKMGENVISQNASSTFEQSASEISANSSFASVADRKFMATSLGKDLDWFNKANVTTQNTITGLSGEFINTSPQLKEGTVLARKHAESTQIQAEKEALKERNRVAIEDAAKSSDPEIKLLAANSIKVTSARGANTTDYMFAIHYEKFKEAQEQLKSGAITQEQYNATKKETIQNINAENKKLESTFNKIDVDALKSMEIFSPKDKNILTAIYTKDTKDTTPTPKEIHKYARDYPVDVKKLNDATHIFNAHKDKGKEYALSQMPADQKKEFLMAQYQANVVTSEIASDAIRLRTALSQDPQKAKQLGAMIESGDKEGAIKALEELKGEPLTEGAKQLILKSKDTSQLKKIMQEVNKIGDLEDKELAQQLSLLNTNIVHIFGFGNDPFNWETFTPYDTKTPAANQNTTVSVSKPSEFSKLLTDNNFTAPNGITTENQDVKTIGFTNDVSLPSLAGVTATTTDQGSPATTGRNPSTSTGQQAAVR
jgi:hypothetical protein